MSTEDENIYEFGPFRLDAAERLLLRKGRTVPLTARLFDILLLLVQNDGHLVEKNYLMSAAWPDRFVEPNNLTVSMSALRRSLGENKRGQRYIETVPRHGYRFVAKVRRRRHGPGRAGSPQAGVAPAIASVAVSMFETPDVAWREYIGLGLASALVAKLGSTRRLAVTHAGNVTGAGGSPVSAARKLGVEAILRGRIEKTGDDLWVTAQLVSTRDEKPIWEAKFE